MSRQASCATILFLILVGMLLSQEKTDKLQERKCEEKQATAEAQTSNQKYPLEYKSGYGDRCRVYHLRNTPGGVKTPICWQDENEVFVRCVLPRCGKDEKKPEWSTFIHTSIDAELRDTKMGYGANHDEVTDKPKAYGEKVGKPLNVEDSIPLVTTIRGRFADPDESSNEIYFVDLTVTSTVEKKDDSYRFTYKMQVSPKSEGLGVPGLEPLSSPRQLRFEWESAESREFLEKIARDRIKVIDGKNTDGKNTILMVTLTGKTVEVRKKRLAVYRGKEALLVATTAAAYVPGK